MAFAINIIDGWGLSNKVHCELLPFNQLYIINKAECFSFKSGGAMRVVKLIKEDCMAYSITEEFWHKTTTKWKD